MSHTAKNRLLILFFIAGLWIVLAIVTQLWLVPKKGIPQNYDLFPLWHGSRAFLQGEDPYSDAFTRELLQGPDYSGSDLYRMHRFYYPATISLILLPLWLTPISVTIVIWCGLQLLLAMTLPLLVFRLLEWPVPPLLLAVVSIFSAVGWRHSANTYVLGQFTLYTLGCFVIAWWMAVQKRPVFVAIALVGATLRAEGIVLVTLAVFYFLLIRHFRIVGIWTGIMAVTFGLSLIPGGMWIGRFFDGIEKYQVYQPTTLPAAITGIDVLTYLIVMGVLAWGAYMVWEIRSLPERFRIPWMLAVAFLVALIVLRQSKDYTLVYALFPIWLIIWAGREQKWNMALMLLISISPWIYNAAGMNMGHGSPIEQFFTPLLLAGLLTYRWSRWKQPYVETSKLEVSGATA